MSIRIRAVIMQLYPAPYGLCHERVSFLDETTRMAGLGGDGTQPEKELFAAGPRGRNRPDIAAGRCVVLRTSSRHRGYQPADPRGGRTEARGGSRSARRQPQ